MCKVGGLFGGSILLVFVFFRALQYFLFSFNSLICYEASFVYAPERVNYCIIVRFEMIDIEQTNALAFLVHR